MTGKRSSVSTSELLDEVARRTKASRRDVEEVWGQAIAVIREDVERGRDVYIAGFGTFRRAKSGRKPPAPEISAEVAEAAAGYRSNLRGALEQVARYAEESRETFRDLLEALTPKHEVISRATLLQLHRNVGAREDLEREFGLLSSGEVAELSRSRARNRAAIANRWKQEGRVFSVPSGNAVRFPGFQFDGEGRPREVVAAILRTFQSRLSEWEMALWFTTASGWLGGRRPVDLLDGDPAIVVKAAAGQIADESAF